LHPVLAGETTANENHQPYRAKMIFLQEQVLFTHRRLPMGKKERPSVISVVVVK